MKRIKRTAYIIITLLFLVVLVNSVGGLLQDYQTVNETETTVEVEVITDDELTDETLVSSDDTESNTTKSTANNLEVATVVRVVDGDTLVVQVDGENHYVRLIGIDAAESVHPDESKNTEEGQEASDHLKSILSAGDIVYLQKDISETDKYGRLLRYVWLEEPTDVWNEDEVTSKMLNAILIIDGYADPVRYEPDISYAELFESL